MSKEQLRNIFAEDQLGRMENTALKNISDQPLVVAD